jgi:hypothetical protein
MAGSDSGSDRNNARRQLRELLSALTNQFKREAIFAILDAYAKLTRPELVDKSNLLQKDLESYMTIQRSNGNPSSPRSSESGQSAL